MDAVEGEEIQVEVEVEKIEVEKVKKPRKPLGEEALGKTTSRGPFGWYVFAVLWRDSINFLSLL